jgi:hypothetical protein
MQWSIASLRESSVCQWPGVPHVVPSEGLRPSLAAVGASPSRQPPLVELATLQSVVRDDVSGCLGYPIPPWRHRCRFACAVFLPSPSAERFHARLILSCALPLLQSLSSHCLPGADVRASFPGLSSLIAASSGGVHRRGLPKPTPFRPRRFSRPRRLAPPPDFAGLFRPAATSRVRSSGVSPDEKPHGLVARRCPRVVARCRARLQGLAPLIHPSRRAVV